MGFIGRFRNKYDLVHFMGPYMEVDLYDMPATNRVIEVIDCDWTLQVHLPNATSPLRFLVGSHTWISLSTMRNEIF